ncbi:MAG: S8 family serine peptidase [Bdellovibrionales bacterium]|nr:S8 family serine peptidase [Bdellovibrionales bacterium]
MNIIRFVVGSIALTSIACSQSDLLKERQRMHAPTATSDVGVILEGAEAAEVQALLARHPAAEVRLLNTEHGMYEVFGVSKDEAQTQTRGRALDNNFFELQSQRSNPWTTLSVAGPNGLKLGKLNACKGGTGGPTAVLQALEPAKLMGQTIDLGQSVKVSGAQSKSSKGPVRQAILVAGPGASVHRQTIVDESQFSFTPDALGVYQIYLVVQDDADLCAMDGARFLVTANRPYSGPAARELSFDLSKLSHLRQVSAEASWQSSQGDGLVIAVIDTGVNYNHPALASAIYVNQKEIAGNGQDDDHNGFADDVVGYDFVNSDAFPYDDDSHGTHVAGLAAGRPFGLAKKAQILPLKALTSIGGDIATISAAIRYATDRGAKIINMSLGAAAPMAHPSLIAAVDYAESKGALIVAAAGNGDPSTGLGYSIDDIPTFPAALPNDNIVSVASFDAENVLSTYSNFGKIGVDVVAPGGLAPNDPMISAAYENPKNGLFMGMTGTSMAAPVVAGIAAQVWSLAPHLTAVEVKEILLQAGPAKSELKSVCTSGRHLNAAEAVDLALQKAALY